MTLPWVAKLMIVAGAYFVAGRLALLMAIPPGYATAVWPAAGIAMVLALVWGYRVWPGILLGSFFVNVGTSFDSSSTLGIVKSVSIAASIGGGAALQGVAGALLVRRFTGYPSSVEREHDIFRLLVLGGPVSCVVGATWGVTTLFLAGIVAKTLYAFSWFTWWVGDSIGAVIFVPLVLAFVGGPARLWRRRRVTVALPLALGFSLVTVLFVRASKWENDRLHAEFVRRAQELANTLDARMNEYLEVCASLASLHDADPRLSRDAFRAFAKRPLERHSGIQALSWLPRVPHTERSAYEGLAGFSIREKSAAGAMVRAAERDEYFPVSFIEPHGRDEAVLGFDVASEMLRLQTLRLSRDSGVLVATPPITLVQDPSQRGFLLLAPVFSGGKPTDTRWSSADETSGAFPPLSLVPRRRSNLRCAGSIVTG